MTHPKPLIAIHGGAGTMSRDGAAAGQEASYHAAPVSYTHLTLPTICSV